MYLDKKFQAHSYLLTVIDHFSKFAWTFLINQINSENIKNCLEIVHQYCNFEIEKVHTDNGTEFKRFFEEYLENYQIIRLLGAAYKPTSQGCVERFNRTIQDQLDKSYRSKISQAEFNIYEELKKNTDMYNNDWIHSTTGKRPAELINKKMRKF